MVKKKNRFFPMSTSTEDGDDDLLESGGSGSLHSLSQPLLSSGDSEVNKKTRNHLLTNSLFGERNKKLAKACVMITVVLERTAYYGLLGNLAYFANIYLDYEADESVNLTLAFSGVTWISCFIGGILGDAFFGRFQTILTGIILYICGYVSLSLIGHYSHDFNNDEGRQPIYVVWFLSSLFVVSLGEGCFKSNMSPFGADQIDSMSDNNELRSFFNYFYWAINIGSLIAFSLIVWIQIKFNFCIGFIVPCALLGLAGFVFIIPRRSNYHVASPKRSVLMIVKILFSSLKKQRAQSTYEEYNPMDGRLDRAKVKYGGKFLDSDVDDVKVLVSLLPTLMFLLIYCSCYYQVNGLFLLQGMHMRLPSIPTKFGGVLPAAWFQLFNVVTVLVCVPIIDKWVYPRMDRVFTRAPHLFRMSIGMILASVAMASAGLVEQQRQLSSPNCTNSINDGKTMIICKDLTILYQLPQYLLLGVSEIFVLITGLEFAYCRAPKSMQSFVTSLFFIVNGFGALMTSAILVIGNKAGFNFLKSAHNPDRTKPTPPLEGNLDHFFFFMAALNFVNWLGFIAYSVRKSRKRKRRDLERTVAAFIQGSYEESLKKS